MHSWTSIVVVLFAIPSHLCESPSQTPDQPLKNASPALALVESNLIRTLSNNPAARKRLWSDAASARKASLPSGASYEVAGVRVQALDLEDPRGEVGNWWRLQKKQIFLDIDGRSRFKSEDVESYGFMLDVLSRIAVRDDKVGYVQGMNLIAFHFMNLGLDKEKVYILVCLFIDEIGVDYFCPQMSGVSRDIQEILGDEKKDFFPTVHKPNPSLIQSVFVYVSTLFAPFLVVSYEEQSSASTLQSILVSWLPSFLTTAILDPQRVLRLWDVILLHGREGWLSLLRHILKAQDCLRLKTDEEKYFCLKTFPYSLDVEAVVDKISRELSWELVPHE